MLKDGNGDTVGKLIGVIPPTDYQSPPLQFDVLIDGGVFRFSSGGYLATTAALYVEPMFKNETCTGPAFAVAGYGGSVDPLKLDDLVSAAGGPTRVVIRRSPTSLRPAQAWEFTDETEEYTGKMWELPSNGGPCISAGAGYVQNWSLVRLGAVPAPGDLEPPLTIE